MRQRARHHLHHGAKHARRRVGAKLALIRTTQVWGPCRR